MSMIGKTLAHYEITSQLGRGGMGDVYQAKDQNLVRKPLAGGIFIHDRNKKTAFSKRIVHKCSLSFLSFAKENP